MRRIISRMSYWHIFLFLTLLPQWQSIVTDNNISSLKIVSTAKKQKSQFCNGHRKWKAWHLPLTFFFLLESSLQMEKSRPSPPSQRLTMMKDRGRPSLEAGPAESSFHPSRSPGRLINPEEDRSDGSSLELTAVRHTKGSKLKYFT